MIFRSNRRMAPLHSALRSLSSARSQGLGCHRGTGVTLASRAPQDGKTRSDRDYAWRLPPAQRHRAHSSDAGWPQSSAVEHALCGSDQKPQNYETFTAPRIRMLRAEIIGGRTLPISTGPFKGARRPSRKTTYPRGKATNATSPPAFLTSSRIVFSGNSRETRCYKPGWPPRNAATRAAGSCAAKRGAAARSPYAPRGSQN